MGKLGEQLQETWHKVHHKFAPHNGYIKLKNEDVVPSDVPKGSFVVYVAGDEMRRFVIQIRNLNHLVFQRLLEVSAEEFGHNPNGGLVLDCDVPFLKHLLPLIEANSPFVREHQIADKICGLRTNKMAS